jgi:hypothetical protein
VSCRAKKTDDSQALVRQKEYKRQQQVANKMYKTFKKGPYYFWAVTSIVMQASLPKRFAAIPIET